MSTSKAPPKARKPTPVERRVSVIVSDSLRTIHLVEVLTRVQFDRDAHQNTRARVSMPDIEKLVDARLEQVSPKVHAEYEIAGVLIALDQPLEQGRIIWAEDDAEAKSDDVAAAALRALARRLRIENEAAP